MYTILGQTRRLTDQFRGVRDARVDKYVVETNKLLIRLDKLVNSDVPTDSSKRKGKKIHCIEVLYYT